MTTRVLVTGANGFIGSVVCEQLHSHSKYEVVSATRNGGSAHSRNHVTYQAEADLDDLRKCLRGAEVVIHIAAYIPAKNESKFSDLEKARQINVNGTLNLARQAASVGVKRFLFISSIKVNGEKTVPGDRFTSFSNTFPEDPYGISKWEAEQALYEVAARTGLEVVIIRPPLVYGPGVKGNFLSMLGWLSRGVPLPLGAIHNQRSLIGVDNLVDLIITCVDHPAAANQIFLVSDDEDLSTTELLRRLGAAMDKQAHLLPFPASLLESAARLVGKQDIVQRLVGNLQIDISKTKETLNWLPPVSVDEGLHKTSKWYVGQ